MSVAVVFGTRPEIIKISPFVRALERSKRPYTLIHTGQHYSYNMDEVFLRELEMPVATNDLAVGSLPHGAQVGAMMRDLEAIWTRERPSSCVILGDTNSALGGALAAAKMGIPVDHIEAGLRSYDRSMPEEINRVVADHVSSLLFAPTEESRANLAKEGIAGDHVHVTGNTIVAAVHENLEIARRSGDAVAAHGLTKGSYVLLTMHRQENVDHPERLQRIVEGVDRVAKETDLPVFFPVHPRTRKRFAELGIDPPRSARLAEPLGYLEFLQLQATAALVMTDSGGLQEESCILRVPCVTLRDNTERPETLAVGANVLAGADPQSIARLARAQLDRPRSWTQPFGDADAPQRMVDILDRAGRF